MFVLYPDHISMVCHGLEMTGLLHLYKLIRTEKPCKVYLDIKCLLLSAEAASPIQDGLAALVEEYVCGCWTHTAAGWRFDPDVILLEGSRPTPKGFKLSFHVIIANLIYECSYAGPLQAFADGVQRHLSACRPDWPPMVDLKVYSCNQKYRMPLSSKISDTTGTILTLPGCHTITCRWLLRALVTMVEPDDTVIWVPGRPSVLGLPTRKRDRPPSGRPDPLTCQAGLESDAARVRALTALLRKKGDHVTSVVRTEMDDDLNGRAVCQQTGPRLCLVSIGRVHASNNVNTLRRNLNRKKKKKKQQEPWCRLCGTSQWSDSALESATFALESANFARIASARAQIRAALPALLLSYHLGREAAKAATPPD
eukprot:697377-Rhodomonas_salina.1